MHHWHIGAPCLNAVSVPAWAGRIAIALLKAQMVSAFLSGPALPGRHSDENTDRQQSPDTASPRWPRYT